MPQGAASRESATEFGAEAGSLALTASREATSPGHPNKRAGPRHHPPPSAARRSAAAKHFADAPLAGLDVVLGGLELSAATDMPVKCRRSWRICTIEVIRFSATRTQ